LTNASDTTNPFYDPRVDLFGTISGRPIPGYTRVPAFGGFKSNSPPLTTAGSPAPRALYDNQGPYYSDTLSDGITNLQSPNELLSATSFGRLDIDLGTLYYEAFFNSRKTRSSSGFRQFFPVYNGRMLDGNLNPFNPFAGLEAFGPGFGFGQPVLPTYELLDPVFESDVERYNAFVGMEGDIGATSWYYDAHVGFGRSSGKYRSQQFLDDRVNASLNGVIRDPVSGAIVCAPSVLAQFPDCVAANLFTEDGLLRGRLPADVLAFLRRDTEGTTTYEGLTFSGFVGGELMRLPAGAVNAIIGAEFREESINDVPDIEAQNNNFWGFSTSGITKGRDQVTEVFTELEFPLLAGRRFAEELSLTGAFRWTDYDSYGSDTTYKLGLVYAVTPEILLRSTFGTSFRPPALFEQFLGSFTGFASNLLDPCINYGSRSQPGDPLYDNCQAEGLEETFTNPSSILVTTSGAAGLNAETSEAFTIGLALTPDWANFSVAVDFFDITVKDTIASPSAGGFLSQCYNSVNFSSAFCSRIGPRNELGRLTFVDNSFLNIGRQQTRGFDFATVYERQLPAGLLSFDGNATYIDKQNSEIFGIVSNFEGRWAFPRWSAQTQTRYDWKDWRLAWSMNYIGKSKEQKFFDPGTTNQNRQNRTPNVVYHTVSARYTAASWQAILTVRNLFDKAPPAVGSNQGSQTANRIANTLPGAGYDLFGRTFVLQVSYGF